MPLYPIRCNTKKCGHEGDEYASMKDSDKICCPKCGGNVTRLVARTRNADRHFAGKQMLSRMEGWPKKDVAKARQLMGSYSHCIRDDGRVEFSKRSEQRGYVRQLEKVEAASGINPPEDPD